MDRGGRFAQSLSRRLTPGGAAAAASPSRITLALRRLLVRVSRTGSIRALEFALMAVIVGGAGIYGTVRGGHLPAVGAWFNDLGDRGANAAGFQLLEADVRGHNRLRRDEILTLAGITDTTSVMLFDADRGRDKLKANPWIAEAVIRKLYPHRIEIEITEREGFALWQRAGKLAIVSRDGTVLEQIDDGRDEKLPLFVGEGAAQRAAEFLAVLERFPLIRDQLYGSVLIAERRWNLRLKSGVDIRLPEGSPAAALATLVELDRTKKILSRDVAMIDLRIPGQVIVKMTDAAAAAFDLQRKPPKKKGAT
jgi:cell division protein FtsQ